MPYAVDREPVELRCRRQLRVVLGRKVEPRFGDLVQRPARIVGQLEGERAHVGVELLQGSRADQRRGDAYLRTNPRPGNLDGGGAEPAATSFSRSITAYSSVTSLSPLQYQKTLRLHRARLTLLNSPGDIGRVGHQVGYQSVSQFSREYRRMFGCPPSADAVRLQSADFGPDL